MKDSTENTPSSRSASLEDRLRTEARRIPAPAQPRFVSQLMQRVRATPRVAPTGNTEKKFGGIPWLMAGATATMAVAVAFVVTSVVLESSAPTPPGQANIPRIVESRLDPVLASPEQQLAGELQRIRADLDSIGRMVSIRLESELE